MKNKIIDIREKYDWRGIFEIIAYKQADKKDRLFMVLMSLWFVPCLIILSILWLILYLPAKLFMIIDDGLN